MLVYAKDIYFQINKKPEILVATSGKGNWVARKQESRGDFFIHILLYLLNFNYVNPLFQL